MSPPRTSPSPWRPSWRSRRTGSASPSETPITRRRCRAPSACPREEAPCERGMMGAWALGGSWRGGPEVGSCALAVELQSSERSPVLRLCRLICSEQWWIPPAGLGQCLGACWCPLQVERRVLQEVVGGGKGGIRGSRTHCSGLSAFLKASWIAKSLRAHGMTRSIL